MKVTYKGTEYECHCALKGKDYIHLLNEAGANIAAFDGIKDFSGFTITGGSWTTPTPDALCPVAVVRPDGTIVPSGRNCDEMASATIYKATLGKSADYWALENGMYGTALWIDDVTVNDLAILVDAADSVWAQGNLSISTDDKAVYFYSKTLPAADCAITLCILRISKITTLSWG